MSTHLHKTIPRVNPDHYTRAPHGYTIIDLDGTIWVKKKKSRWAGMRIATGYRKALTTQQLTTAHNGDTVELYNPLTNVKYPPLLSAAQQLRGTICITDQQEIIIKTYKAQWCSLTKDTTYTCKQMIDMDSQILGHYGHK